MYKAYLHAKINPTIYDSAYQVIFIGPKLTATGSKLKFVN